MEYIRTIVLHYHFSWEDWDLVPISMKVFLTHPALFTPFESSIGPVLILEGMILH